MIYNELRDINKLPPTTQTGAIPKHSAGAMASQTTAGAAASTASVPSTSAPIPVSHQPIVIPTNVLTSTITMPGFRSVVRLPWPHPIGQLEFNNSGYFDSSCNANRPARQTELCYIRGRSNNGTGKLETIFNTPKGDCGIASRYRGLFPKKSCFR